MKLSKFKWMYLGIGLLLIFGFYLNTATADSAPVNISIPGTSVATQQNPNPAGIIINFYQFALMLGGLLAFVIIVFAAIQHTVSADNPSKQSDAKDMIKQALLGLLLLAGAYIVLNTINPRLTNLKLPTLNRLATSTPRGGGGCLVQTDCAETEACSQVGTCLSVKRDMSNLCNDPGRVCPTGTVCFNVTGACMVSCTSDSACPAHVSGLIGSLKYVCKSFSPSAISVGAPTGTFCQEE